MIQNISYLNKLAVLLSVAALGFFLQGCETTKGTAAVESYNASPLTVSVPSSLSAQQVSNAMGATLAGREWTITESSSDKFVGTLNHRGYNSTVTLQRSGNVIQILNNTTWFNEKKGQYEPAVPMRWLENIQKDLQKRLVTASYKSYE